MPGLRFEDLPGGCAFIRAGFKGLRKVVRRTFVAVLEVTRGRAAELCGETLDLVSRPQQIVGDAYLLDGVAIAPIRHGLAD